jgi:phospholipase C
MTRRLRISGGRGCGRQWASAIVLGHIPARAYCCRAPEPPFQEHSVRPSRRLPYKLDAVTRVDATASRVMIDFRNMGKVGAVFHVYDRLHLDRIPKRYTVEAGKTLSDVWEAAANGGKYDLSVYAPNGFRRDITGDTAGAEIDVQYKPAQQKVRLGPRATLRAHTSVYM